MLPGSSSVFSTSLASVLYFTRTPVWDVRRVDLALREVERGVLGRAVDRLAHALDELVDRRLVQLTSAASSVLIDSLRRLRHERENMSPSCERLSALSTEPRMSIPIAAAFCVSVNVRSW